MLETLRNYVVKIVCPGIFVIVGCSLYNVKVSSRGKLH